MMTRIFLLAIIFLTSPLGTSSGNASSFDEANTQYEQGDFKAAAAAYEKLAQAKNPSAAVYFNLGNSYFRLDKRGEALAEYLRAQRLEPRNEAIVWNIGLLKSTFVDHMASEEDGLLFYFLRKGAGYVTLGELALIFLSSTFLLLVLTLGSFLSPLFRKRSGFLRGLLVIFSVAVFSVFLFKFWDEKEATVVILEKEVAARYGPSAKETVAFRIHEGAEARVLDQVGDWYYAAFDKKRAAWVPKKVCELV